MNEVDHEIAELKKEIEGYVRDLKTAKWDERKELLKLINTRGESLNKLMDRRDGVSASNVAETINRLEIMSKRLDEHTKGESLLCMLL